jgi:lysozyme
MTPDHHGNTASTTTPGTGRGAGLAALVAMVGAAAAAMLLSITPYFEGTVHRGYVDPAGIVTACTGHTLTAQLRRTYTDAECAELLAKDLVSHARPVMACVRVPMAPHTTAAVVDLAFNIGPAAVCNSSVVRLINAGQLQQGCAAIRRFVFVRLGGPSQPLRDCRAPEYARRCGGIVTRRDAQAELCSAPPTGQEPYL